MWEFKGKINNIRYLTFISKYSILKQKIASAATDALRLARLEAHGYKTDAIEFIDPDDTPKNILLRGILRPMILSAHLRKRQIRSMISISANSKTRIPYRIFVSGMSAGALNSTIISILR